MGVYKMTINKTAIYWFIICILIFSFVINSNYIMRDKIDIPHISSDIPPFYMVVTISVLFLFICITVKKNVSMDYVCLLLLFRLGLHMFSLVYETPGNEAITQFVISGMCFVTYYIGLNYMNDQVYCQRMFLATFFLICTQVVLEMLLSTNSFFGDTYFYKNDLVIPIGASNAIASKLVPIYAFLMCNSNNKKMKIVLSSLLFFTVGLTKSRGGIIISLIAFGIVTIWKGNHKLKDSIKIMFTLLIVGVTFYIFTENSIIGKYVFSESNSTIIGRKELWKNGIEIYHKHIFFGNGFTKEVLRDNPHNFIISILMRSGLIGMVLAIMMAIIIFVKLKNYTEDSFIRGCICFGVCMIGHGLVEIVLFSYICDFLLWLILGCAMNRAKQLASLNNRILEE